jgi:hypothetical protein
MTTKETSSPWHQTDVNYALVETKRPPMYTAMKYWGKKPHNIWAEFIESYCPPGGVVLDPFGGSAVAGFEAIKNGRRAICLDLNPLTSFLVKTVCSTFNRDEFIAAFNEIAVAIETDVVYRRHYYRDWDDGQALIYNYRWDGGNLVKLAIETPSGERKLIDADGKDKELANAMLNLHIPFWYPQDIFPNTPSITHKFIKDIGGNGFHFLWTHRNLYLLAKIFDLILKQSKLVIQNQLMFAFLQTLHLTSKMVVPRDTKSGRDFSGSWGRADYMVRKRSMEQNPLIVFRRSCIGKQSTLSALTDASNSLPIGRKISERGGPIYLDRNLSLLSGALRI